jgi:hypothetical protein
MATFYNAQTLIRLTTVVTVASVLADPTAMTCKVIAPDGTVSDITASIVKDSAGNYHADYLPLEVGAYQYEWIGTGSVQVSGVRTFIVNQGMF